MFEFKFGCQNFGVLALSPMPSIMRRSIWNINGGGEFDRWKSEKSNARGSARGGGGGGELMFQIDRRIILIHCNLPMTPRRIKPATTGIMTAYILGRNSLCMWWSFSTNGCRGRSKYSYAYWWVVVQHPELYIMHKLELLSTLLLLFTCIY